VVVVVVVAAAAAAAVVAVVVVVVIVVVVRYDTIRYDTRCYFNVGSKADISRLNLPHGNDN